MGQVIAVANQKGGVGKTTSTLNIAAGLAAAGKKVLVVDMDPQGNLTKVMGYIPGQIENTITELFEALIRTDPIDRTDIRELMMHTKGIDLIPANISLSPVELAMVTTTAREYLLKEILGFVKDDYDYILIDCPPSLSVLVVNALTAADSVLVPVKAEFLNAEGFGQLKQSIDHLKYKTNKLLKIQGVFLTMCNERLTEAQDTMNDVRKLCEENCIRMFETRISASTDAAVAVRQGKHIFEYKPQGKVTKGYRNLVKEILSDER